jgi:DNA modification methylase
VTVKILQGDVLEILGTLDAESVQTVVTSPPYWGLRDYQIPPSVWGGDADCEHNWGEDIKPAGYRSNENRNTEGLTSPAIERRDQWQTSAFCVKCGAWLGQLGLEPTPELYVEHLVMIFQEIKRVLRDDGVVWLNLGDSYASGKGTCYNPGGGENSLGQERKAAGVHPLDRGNKSALAMSGLKPKDLVGIPWRVAFALQADGWWLRSDIIWHKPNPMPESVTDRCTNAHEYVFMLSKAARYYYDAEAVKEPFADERMGNPGAYRWAYGEAVGKGKGPTSLLQEDGSVKGWNIDGGKSGRNRRDVWTISTKPCPLAHFATMPPELAETCILAGSAEGDTVLDPFGGAGTTGLVADRLGRDAILIELNPDYCEMARKRIQEDGGMWAEVEIGEGT